MTPGVAIADCEPSLTVGKAAGSVAIEWVPVFAAEAYDVIRGSISNLTVGTTVSLGAVICLVEDGTGTTAIDADALPPGDAEFYLVRYKHFVTLSGYGRSSAGQERLPDSGDCLP